MKRQPFAKVPIPGEGIGRNLKQGHWEGNKEQTYSRKPLPELPRPENELFDVNNNEKVDGMRLKTIHEGDGDFAMSPQISYSDPFVDTDRSPCKTSKSPLSDSQLMRPKKLGITTPPIDYSMKSTGRYRGPPPHQFSREQAQLSEVPIVKDVDHEHRPAASFDESSCSMDGHMVRMNLYGTDQDPSYEEENPRPPVHLQQQQQQHLSNHNPGLQAMSEAHTMGTFQLPADTDMVDLLKKPDARESYVCDGFDKLDPPGPGQFEDFQTRNVIHDVDLLNTPPQLPTVDCLTRHLGKPIGPGDTQQAQILSPTMYQGSVTYNDVHVHGGKWTFERNQYGQNTDSLSNGIKSDFVNMYPYENTGVYPKMRDGHNCHAQLQDKGGQYWEDRRLWRPFVCTHNASSTFRGPIATPSPQGTNSNLSSPHTPGSLGYDRQDTMGRLGQVSMTFTPRDVLEMHLSYNRTSHPTPVQPIPDTHYSTIYPTHSLLDISPRPNITLTENKSPTQDDILPPKKRLRTSKSSSSTIASCDEKSSFDEFPQYISDPERLVPKHKYFVVNPSDIKEMSSKILLNKYIDFLIVENEHLTEISKITTPPVDIYVTEDMYFMDTLKYKIPFPSQKFSDWVTSFYPKLDLSTMKFKGRLPDLKCTSRQIDTRPTQQILEDTFYFFQRELMNARKDN